MFLNKKLCVCVCVLNCFVCTYVVSLCVCKAGGNATHAELMDLDTSQRSCICIEGQAQRIFPCVADPKPRSQLLHEQNPPTPADARGSAPGNKTFDPCRTTTTTTTTITATTTSFEKDVWLLASRLGGCCFATAR